MRRLVAAVMVMGLMFVTGLAHDEKHAKGDKKVVKVEMRDAQGKSLGMAMLKPCWTWRDCHQESTRCIFTRRRNAKGRISSQPAVTSTLKIRSMD
jgi:hypothetical protein